jgi:hypothetical protein
MPKATVVILAFNLRASARRRRNYCWLGGERPLTIIVEAAIVEAGPALSVGAVSDKLLEINATDDFGLIVAKNNGRAARRGAVPVLVRGPATLCRASSLFSQ